MVGTRVRLTSFLTLDLNGERLAEQAKIRHVCLLALGFATHTHKMNTFVGAFKNQLVVAAICVGAAIVAILV
ncbi:MAG TPA: hypothetical protein VFN63_10690, partial [Pseudolabrys sp.]|nr:hypothetical protein [Pseudolabrys sp.]